MSRTERLLAVILPLLYVVAVIAITAASGALGIARNDDWSFYLNAFHFHNTGIVAVGGWVQMNLIGQLVIAWPLISLFGESIAPLQVLGALLTGVLVGATYWLVRTFLAARFALIAALAVAVSPVVLVLAVSFMTDVPAAAGQVLALALAAVALAPVRAHAERLWFIALMVSFWAFSVREYSIAAIAAILIAGYLSTRIRTRLFVVAVSATGLFVIAVMWWRLSQVTETDNIFGPNPDGLPYLWSLPVTLGFLTLPVLIAVHPVKLLRTSWANSRVITVVALGVIVISFWRAPSYILGNYFQRTPAYAQVMVGEPAPLLPAPLWWVIVCLGAYGALIGALLVGMALRAGFLGLRNHQNEWRRLASTSPGVVLAGTYALLIAILISTLPLIAKVPVFDRYLIGLAAVGAPVLLWWAHEQQLILKFVPAIMLAWLALTVLVLVGITNFLASARIDAARWALAREVSTSAEIAPGNIDAGFDWFRFERDGIPRPEAWPPRFSWWSLTDDRAVCATVTYIDPPLAGDSAWPDSSLPTLAQAEVTYPFGQQTLVVRPGPDSCS